MESIKRYMIVQGIQTQNGELIPIWDNRLKFDKDDCGGMVRILDKFEPHYSMVDMVFDLKTKTISAGIFVDYYGEIYKRNQNSSRVRWFLSNLVNIVI